MAEAGRLSTPCASSCSPACGCTLALAVLAFRPAFPTAAPTVTRPQDPSNRSFILADDALKGLTGEARFKAFGFSKFIKQHIIS